MPVTLTQPAPLPEQSALARLRDTLRDILGEPNLKTIEPAWLEKMREGVIVVLHIGRTRGECELHEQECHLTHIFAAVARLCFQSPGKGGASLGVFGTKYGSL